VWIVEWHYHGVYQECFDYMCNICDGSVSYFWNQYIAVWEMFRVSCCFTGQFLLGQ